MVDIYNHFIGNKKSTDIKRGIHALANGIRASENNMEC